MYTCVCLCVCLRACIYVIYKSSLFEPLRQVNALKSKMTVEYAKMHFFELCNRTQTNQDSGPAAQSSHSCADCLSWLVCETARWAVEPLKASLFKSLEQIRTIHSELYHGADTIAFCTIIINVLFVGCGCLYFKNMMENACFFNSE